MKQISCNWLDKCQKVSEVSEEIIQAIIDIYEIEKSIKHLPEEEKFKIYDEVFASAVYQNYLDHLVYLEKTLSFSPLGRGFIHD